MQKGNNLRLSWITILPHNMNFVEADSDLLVAPICHPGLKLCKLDPNLTNNRKRFLCHSGPECCRSCSVVIPLSTGPARSMKKKDITYFRISKCNEKGVGMGKVLHGSQIENKI